MFPFEKLDAFGIDRVEELLGEGLMMARIAEKAGVPAYSLTRWLAADEQRSARANKARQAASEQWDAEAEQVLKDTDIEEISRARELAQHYRWRASKLDPRRYGDKVAHTGADGGPIQVITGVSSPAPDVVPDAPALGQITIDPA